MLGPAASQSSSFRGRRFLAACGAITSLATHPQNGRLWVATVTPDTPDASVLHELDPAGQQVLRQRLALAEQVERVGLRRRDGEATGRLVLLQQPEGPDEPLDPQLQLALFHLANSHAE